MAAGIDDIGIGALLGVSIGASSCWHCEHIDI